MLGLGFRCDYRIVGSVRRKLSLGKAERSIGREFQKGNVTATFPSRDPSPLARGERRVCQSRSRLLVGNICRARIIPHREIYSKIG